MNLTPEALDLCLDEDQLLALDDACGTTIRPREGRLWITEEGEPRDFVVGPGEAFVVTRAGRTLVQAVAPTRVALRSGARVGASNDA